MPFSCAKIATMVACLLWSAKHVSATTCVQLSATVRLRQLPLASGRTVFSRRSSPSHAESADMPLRLRGGGAEEQAKSGALFAASITRWQHDDIMQVQGPRASLSRRI
jgi:hypothetical protein